MSKKLHRYNGCSIYFSVEGGQDDGETEYYIADEAQAEIDRLQKEVDDITDNYYRILTAYTTQVTR